MLLPSAMCDMCATLHQSNLISTYLLSITCEIAALLLHNRVLTYLSTMQIHITSCIGTERCEVAQSSGTPKMVILVIICGLFSRVYTDLEGAGESSIEQCKNTQFGRSTGIPSLAVLNCLLWKAAGMPRRAVAPTSTRPGHRDTSRFSGVS